MNEWMQVWWWENPFLLARLLRPTIFFFMTSSRSFLLRPENVVFLPSTGFFGFYGKLIREQNFFDPISARGRPYLRTSAAFVALFISRGRLKTRSRCFFSPRNFFSTFSTYLVPRQPYIRQKKLHTWPKFTQHTANNALFEGRERRKKKDNRRRRSNKWNLTSCQRLWPQLEFFRFFFFSPINP